jgi:hypothetical protein
MTRVSYKLSFKKFGKLPDPELTEAICFLVKREKIKLKFLL